MAWLDAREGARCGRASEVGGCPGAKWTRGVEWACRGGGRRLGGEGGGGSGGMLGPHAGDGEMSGGDRRFRVGGASCCSRPAWRWARWWGDTGDDGVGVRWGQWP